MKENKEKYMQLEKNTSKFLTFSGLKGQRWYVLPFHATSESENISFVDRKKCE